MAIKFNNIPIPTFVKVNDIQVSALPPVSQKTMKVSGKAGSYDFGNEIGERRIEVAVSIIANSPSDLEDKTREFAEWLYYDEAKEFVILDEPDKYYMAKVTGESDINKVLKVGQGTITFICTDPYAYGYEKTFDLIPREGEEINFENTGGTTTYPTIRVVFSDPTTEFAIVSGDEYLKFGKPVDLENQTPKDNKPLILWDEMHSLTGWTAASSVDGGIIQGSFSTNGYAFSQAGADFGSNPNGWHGAAAVKGLSKQIQDFTVQAMFGFVSGWDYGQVGRIEVYLLDVNGNKLGKLAVKDISLTSWSPTFEAFAGSNKNIAYVTKNNKLWNNMYTGSFSLTRIGNRWTANISTLENYKATSSASFDWVDVGNTVTGKLAQIQIHIGAYKDHKIQEVMNIQDIKVWEHVSLEQNEVPYIFKAGDILEVNCETGMILKNNIPYYEDLDPSSRFIKFEKGSNGLKVAPMIIESGTVTYKERWL
ncbi:phage tail family protein [Neobacillus sedimentimangrovi]|uniref:Phage tail family protein n=1 Tax=Neobacillus sedimentimangrovi TaxID=2699460 RepID=A0ABS8QKR5_9BACI|nr:distal tail protein Dit [Neobacillus sedimentimangrovi]MCD4839763.1 phage tail family protein [Neobacillus sedimentimangrovi]